MLEVVGVDASYRAVVALSQVSLTVASGEIVALIGANGAGKSTLLNVISGIVRATGGDVRFEGESILRSTPAHIVRRGVVQVPEGRQVFGDLTVLENLEIGAFTCPKADRSEIGRVIYDLFPRLRERSSQLAGYLSGGEQQMLALGRALMARPRLLLLDEPSMGIAPMVVAEMFRVFRQINRELGITILLVEQNARAALKLADRAYLLSSGRIAYQGRASDLLDDAAVSDAFLGRRVSVPANVDTIGNGPQ